MSRQVHVIRYHQLRRMKIIEDKHIYPGEKVPILEHYKENFDLVKICFLPFIQIDSESNISSGRASQQISLEELKAKDELFKNIIDVNAEIYESNESYPKAAEILESGKIIDWETIILETNLENYREINRALRTSIGAYKTPLSRPDLLHKLEEYTDDKKIWFPIEGQFDTFTKIGIYKLLKQLGKEKVFVVKEGYEETKELNIKELAESEFIEQIEFDDYYIYSQDETILFAISWDDYFYFLATKKEYLETVEQTIEIEGFNATNRDSHLWDWEEGEIDELLEKTKSEKKTPWWKSMLKRKN